MEWFFPGLVMCALLALDSRTALEVYSPLCCQTFSRRALEKLSPLLPAKARGRVWHPTLLEVASQPALENRELGKKSLEFYKVVTTARL